MNFLEQLTSEWLEYSGYFVRRNVLVGRREKGGYECELDVVAFHPETKHLVHVEPSMDANTWLVRNHRFTKKFEAGRNHIPTMFEALATAREIDQVALFGYGSRASNTTCGGGRILFVDELITEIRETLRDRPYLERAVSEQFVCLRTIQFTMHAEQRARDGVVAGRPLVRANVAAE